MSWLNVRRPASWPLVGRLWRKAPGGTWIRGRYLLGPEVSWFQPEGSAERWWTSFGDTAAGEADKLMDAARGHGVEVELRGDLSKPGEWGHLGMYSRAFVVRGIRRVPAAGSTAPRGVASWPGRLRRKLSRATPWGRK